MGQWTFASVCEFQCVTLSGYFPHCDLYFTKQQDLFVCLFLSAEMDAQLH